MNLILDGNGAIIAFFVIVFIFGIVLMVWNYQWRINRGDVYHYDFWQGQGMWLPKSMLKGHKGEPRRISAAMARRIARRNRQGLSRKSRYLCFSCEAEIPIAAHFCPSCGEEQKNVPPQRAEKKKRRRKSLGRMDAEL